MAMLHIENLENGLLNFKMKGDKAEIAAMLRKVLETRPDVIPVLAGAVFSFFKDHNLDYARFVGE